MTTARSPALVPARPRRRRLTLVPAPTPRADAQWTTSDEYRYRPASRAGVAVRHLVPARDSTRTGLCGARVQGRTVAWVDGVEVCPACLTALPAPAVSQA